MRVWIINHYAIPPSMGGLVRHYYFSKFLRERGHQVRIFTASEIHNTDINMIRDGALYREETMDGVPYTFLKTRDYSGNGLSRIINMLEFPLRTTVELGEYPGVSRSDSRGGSRMDSSICRALALSSAALASAAAFIASFSLSFKSVSYLRARACFSRSFSAVSLSMSAIIFFALAFDSTSSSLAISMARLALICSARFSLSRLIARSRSCKASLAALFASEFAVYIKYENIAAQTANIKHSKNMAVFALLDSSEYLS